MNHEISVVMIGATGAVGSHTAQTLARFPQIRRLTLLGRRPLQDAADRCIVQHKIDIFEPATYRDIVHERQAAICTLGVGQPSKMDKELFLKIDKLAVLEFAAACKEAGIRHFELLGSVGSSSSSRSFYLRSKGELVGSLRALNFERLSIFQPSMILTPTNRYGLSQAVTLFLWPLLKPILIGGLRKYRGIPVEQLGKAMALNLLEHKSGQEILHWDDFISLNTRHDLPKASI